MGVPSKIIAVHVEENSPAEEEAFWTRKARTLAAVLVVFLLVSVAIGLLVGLHVKPVVEEASLSSKRRSSMLLSLFPNMFTAYFIFDQLLSI